MARVQLNNSNFEGFRIASCANSKQNELGQEFTELLYKTIVSKSIAELGGVDNNTDYVNKIKCKNCGKSEAYILKRDPRRIFCNRSNNCVGSVSYSEYFPSVFTDCLNEFKSSTSYINDEFARHRIYAEGERKLSNFDKLGGEYGFRYLENKSYACLRFKLDDGKSLNERLIDCSIRKSNNVGEVSKRMYVPFRVDFTRSIYIAENPIDAMSLTLSAIPDLKTNVISCLSATCRPERKEWIAENISAITSVVICFDKDNAGISAAKRWKEYFESLHKKVSVLFTAKNKDWNECLKDDSINSSNFLQKCISAGRFHTAKNAFEAAQALQNVETGVAPRVFEFDDSLYKTTYKKNTKTDENELTNVVEILDGTLKALYSLETKNEADDSISNKTYIKAKPKFKPASTITIDADEWTNSIKFAMKMSNTKAMTFSGDLDDVRFIKKHILKSGKLEDIRALTKFGYDKESDSYVFRNVAIDKEGNVLNKNDADYYSEIKAMPFYTDDKDAIEFGKCDKEEVVKDLYAAWGNNAITTMGFYAASLFSHVIYSDASYGFFPFLSMHGDQGTGKSTLVKCMNLAFSFRKDEGITLNSINTKKGLARSMAQRSSIVMPFLEGNAGEGFVFDENSLKSLYNRENPQFTAVKTTDNRTRSMTFDACLLFVQNHEFFTSGPVKERAVSIKFEKNDKTYNRDSLEAVYRLKNLGSKISGFGIDLLKDRKFIDDNIISYIKKSTAYIVSKGVTNQRVLDNHAIILGTVELIFDRYCKSLENKEEILNNIRSYIIELCGIKSENNRDDTDLADEFFDAFEDMSEIKRINGFNISELKEGEDYIKEDGLLYIKMTNALKDMSKNKYTFTYNKNLKTHIKKHKRFVECNKAKRFGNRVCKVWVFTA